MKTQHNTFHKCKYHFDWIAQRWANWAKNGQFYNVCLISQNLSDEIFSNRTKWRPIITPFSGLNAILIESPEGGQIGQKWVKNGQFYKVCLISQKLCDEFIFLIESNEGSSLHLSAMKMPFWFSPQIGQKWVENPA